MVVVKARFIIYYFNNDWGAITQITEYDIYILKLK